MNGECINCQASLGKEAYDYGHCETCHHPCTISEEEEEVDDFEYDNIKLVEVETVNVVDTKCTGCGIALFADRKDYVYCDRCIDEWVWITGNM